MVVRIPGQPGQFPLVSGPDWPPLSPATGTALRADVVICTYTLARWELLARAVESVLAQTRRPTATDHRRGPQR